MIVLLLAILLLDDDIILIRLNIEEIVEYNIGHSIISRAIITGLEKAVRDMVDLIKKQNPKTS